MIADMFFLVFGLFLFQFFYDMLHDFFSCSFRKAKNVANKDGEL